MNRVFTGMFRHPIVRRWTVILVVLYMSVIVMLAVLQRKLMYQPATGGDFSIAAYPDLTRIYPDSDHLWLTTDDGVRIGGWHMKHADQAALPADQRQLLIIFHGNAGDRAGRTGWYQLFQSLGLDVLAIDYRGYGDSDGSPSETGLKKDAIATWKHATQRLGYQPSRSVIFGVSLGGAVAVHLAHDVTQQGTPPAALVVIATFSSMTDVAGFHYWWLPVRWVLQDRYPSEDEIRDLTCPLLQFHGDEDSVVPMQFGERLFAAAPETSVSGIPKQWVRLPQTGHNGLAQLSEHVMVPAMRQLLNRISETAGNSIP